MRRKSDKSDIKVEKILLEAMSGHMDIHRKAITDSQQDFTKDKSHLSHFVPFHNGVTGEEQVMISI